MFVCKCVLYYCNRLSTQLQLTNISVSAPLMVRKCHSRAFCFRVMNANFWSYTCLCMINACRTVRGVASINCSWRDTFLYINSIQTPIYHVELLSELNFVGAISLFQDTLEVPPPLISERASASSSYVSCMSCCELWKHCSVIKLRGYCYKIIF